MYDNEDELTQAQYEQMSHEERREILSDHVTDSETRYVFTLTVTETVDGEVSINSSTSSNEEWMNNLDFSETLDLVMRLNQHLDAEKFSFDTPFGL